MSLYQIEMSLHSIHYRNVSSLSSDSDHSDQSASASNTPPAERKKPSTSTRQHKGTHKHKVLHKHKKSKKRQRVVSSSNSSSTSSSATSSDSFDSDHVTTTKKHKKKTHHKKHSKKISSKSLRKGKVQHSALMQYASNYLKPYYQNESVARDDKLSIAPCSEFISLALVDKGRTIHEDDTFSKASLDSDVDEIRGAKSPLELDDIVPSGTRFVLVEGPPGIGKSTLAWELCRKWDTLTSLKHYKMVLLLKLRERRVQNATSLEDLIHHEDKRFQRKVVNEVRKCEGEGVLFMLDGFDEMPSVVHDENRLIIQLISGSCLPKATRLVTSRPSALKSYFPQGFRHVEVCGFTDECKVRFAEIAFKSEPKVLAHFKDFIFSNPVINSLMYIPVNCAIIAQVYKDIRKSRELMPKTMTQLYTILTLVLIRRHMISSGQWDKHSKVPSSLKDLPESVSIDLEKVSKLAYSGLFKEDVQLVFTDSDVGEGFEHLGLMNAVKEMYVCEGAATSYSFLHLSIQEFLAAWYVSCHSDLVDEASSKIVSQSGQVTPHLRVFGQFLCGIVGYNEKIFQGILTQSSYQVHCLYEIRDISELKLDIKTSLLQLYNPLDMYVFGYCLVHVPIQCQLVFINTSLEMLMHSLSEHTKKTNGGTLGTIKHLHIVVHHGVHVSSKLTSLTKYFPKFHIDSLTLSGISSPLVPVLSDWISKSLPGLTSIALDFSESCEDDCLLYQSIQHITNLEKFSLVCRTPTQKGVQELCKIISTSSTLTKSVLQCHPALLSDVAKPLPGDPSLPTLGDLLPYKRSELFTSYELYPVLQAALSSSTISTLDTNFGYRVCTNAGSIEHVTLELIPSTSLSSKIHPLEVLRSFQYLSCIAEMNSIKSIRVGIHNIDDILLAMPHFCCNYIMSLKDSLHHSMENLNFVSSRYFTHDIKSNPPFRDCMAHALRRDPAVPRHNLRRSQSLCDLRTLHFPHRHQLLQQHDSPRPLSLLRYRSHPSYGWRHILLKYTGHIQPSLYQSCPDLLEMQALQNMHPLLQKALKYDQLYYKKTKQLRCTM